MFLRRLLFVYLLMFVTCVLTLSLSESTFAQMHNCAGIEGDPYYVGWHIGFTNLECFYVAGYQGYQVTVQGINHTTYSKTPCGATAPCEPDPDEVPEVPIEASFKQPIAKFAWRLDTIDFWGDQDCPTTPETRWSNLMDMGGLIHASPYIDLFTDAGKVD